MLQVDVLSAYVICGAGSLAGAAMMRLHDAKDMRTRQALDFSTLGFLLLGLSMGSVYFAGASPGLVSQSLIAAGSLASMVFFTSGLALLTGEEPLARPQAAALLVVAALLALLGPLAGERVLAQALALGLAATSTLMSLKTRHFVWRPRDHAERAVGWSVAALTVSAWARVGFSFTTAGDPGPHLLHVPGWLLSPFAVLYGTLPILVATLMLSLVNARLSKHLHGRATTDELTGALTRRALRELAPAVIERCSHDGGRLGVLMLDLDHFKLINDRFGHASGDLVLHRTGEVLRAQLRPDALLARYGGEEFVALVPVAELHVARQVAERMRDALATTAWVAADGRTMTVTASVGLALLGDSETFDAALHRADQALYCAKHEGRNRVQVSLTAA